MPTTAIRREREALYHLEDLLDPTCSQLAALAVFA